MCLSFLGQILFGIIMAGSLGLTLASMFTPGWKQFSAESGFNIENLKKLEIPETLGIFPFFCQMPNANITNTTSVGFAYCKQWWENLLLSDKAVVAAMCLALIVEIVTVIWTILSIAACCCKSCLIQPLPVFATIITILLSIAVILYGIDNKNDIDFINKISDFNELESKIQSKVGYSFYLACGALLGAVIDIVIGILIVTLAKRCF
ncbi:unnamed protein product [Dracunculus medinensis]|uniref:Transmembrane protein n=1 Tax=Dracunculus medinensis TaxID=318479 RepID=A0A0N4UK05_DRAME|nr:unnamed protein product [Dracunculus medinensis]